ncbi:anti-sigma factor family protein [Saccharothrix variisporea]|uniref:Putative zinc finger protein n=1 Tax=Saccharothrix variisporea TaxID=543527 RepID=A0A495X1Z2_9PSEU|nr:zf-HC2 domain-containing protein [Saccharothrix variisporea]RKT67897.1 putative zinc finger protein [Saccharothrix variisporea]
MRPAVDPYRDWGAAYVLGSLSPAERREFEVHLAGCPDCAANLASLAGLPGILSVVPRERAAALLEPEPEGGPSVLAGLLAAERSRRRRARVLTAAAVLVAALMGAAVVFLLRPAPPTTTPGPPQVAMRQTVPSPVTAAVRLVDEPWGTRIEVRCSYDRPVGKSAPTVEYGLNVVDGRGRAVQVATWTAGPGSTTRPVATTKLVRSDVTAVEIRLLPDDLVILRVEF